MKHRYLSRNELKPVYDTVLTEAFPPEELKPLSLLEAMIEQDDYDVIECAENGQPVGYFLIWKHRQRNFVLMDYFCVLETKRNTGIGAKMLNYLQSILDGAAIIAESEAPTGNIIKDEMILRRLAFYERNGARDLGYDCELFGVHFKCIAWADEHISNDVLMQKHRDIYKDSLPAIMFESRVKIPYIK